MWPHNEYGKHLNYFVDEVHRFSPQSKDHIKRSEKEFTLSPLGSKTLRACGTQSRPDSSRGEDSALCQLELERSALPPEVECGVSGHQGC